MSGDDSTISAEEYAGWIKPQDAMRDAATAMEDEGYASNAIGRCLNNGATRAASKRVIWHESDQQRVETYALIDPLLWQRAMLDADAPLWKCGNIDIYLDGAGATVNLTARNHDFVELDGVRFEPSGLTDMFPLSAASIPAQIAPVAPPEAPAASPTRKQDRPLVPDPILQAWAAWYRGSATPPTQEGAYASASFLFANHNVSRETVRDLFKDVAMGRPKNTDT